MMLDTILQQSGVTRAQVTAVVESYPTEVGDEDAEELRALRFERDQVRTKGIAGLIGNRNAPGTSMPTHATQHRPTGAAAQEYASAAATEEISKRHRVATKAHGTQEGLKLADDRISQRNPPPAHGGTTAVQEEYARLNTLEEQAVRTHLATPQFTATVPELCSSSLSHITQGQIGEFPQFAFLRTGQQGAVTSLSHYVLTQGLHSLNTTDLKKQTAMVFGDFYSSDVSITIEDFNSGTMVPFIGPAAIPGHQFTKACKHLVHVLVMLHPALLRADLDAEFD